MDNLPLYLMRYPEEEMDNLDTQKASKASRITRKKLRTNCQDHTNLAKLVDFMFRTSVSRPRNDETLKLMKHRLKKIIVFV